MSFQDRSDGTGRLSSDRAMAPHPRGGGDSTRLAPIPAGFDCLSGLLEIITSRPSRRGDSPRHRGSRSPQEAYDSSGGVSNMFDGNSGLRCALRPMGFESGLPAASARREGPVAASSSQPRSSPPVSRVTSDSCGAVPARDCSRRDDHATTISRGPHFKPIPARDARQDPSHAGFPWQTWESQRPRQLRGCGRQSILWTMLAPGRYLLSRRSESDSSRGCCLCTGLGTYSRRC